MEQLHYNFENVFCKGKIVAGNNDNDITIIGAIKEGVKDNIIYYIAAAPPDYRATYTGSGLPFANQEQAFDNSPNIGKIIIANDGTFKLNIMYPNSYYVGLGTVMVPPTVFFQYHNIFDVKRTVSIKISEGIPYRMLTYPMDGTRARTDAMFYKDGWMMPVRTQEQILRDSAYPSVNKMHSNFWGLKPPQ